MKPLPTALAITAVLGAVALTYHNRPGASAGDSGEAASGSSGAKASDRPTPVTRDDRATELPPKMTRRDSTPSQPSAEDKLRRIVGEEKYLEIKKARAAAELARLNEGGSGTLGGKTGTARLSTDRQAEAIEALRENLRTAVNTSPDTWQETYSNLYSDYLASNHPNLAPMFTGRGTPTPAPTNPAPAPEGPGTAPGGGEARPKDITYFDTPEARKQAEEARRHRDYVFGSPLEARSQQDPRFRLPK